MIISGHFHTISHRFPTISDPFLTISGPFLTISDPFLTISGRFVNRSTSSRLILTISRPPLDQFSIVRKQLSHTDHSGAVQQWTTRPPKQEHRPNRTRPLTGGTTWGQRIKTQEKVIDNSNTHTTPTLFSDHLLYIPHQFSPDYRPFHGLFRPRITTTRGPLRGGTTGDRPATETRTTVTQLNPNPPGPLTGGTTWDHRGKSHRQHQHTRQHIVGLMSFRRRSKVRGRGGGGGGGGGGKVEPY